MRRSELRPPLYPSSPAAGPDGSKMSKRKGDMDVVEFMVFFITMALIFLRQR